MSRRFSRSVTMVLTAMFALLGTHSFACMSFQMPAKDGSVMIGRTMEMGVDCHWKLGVVPRNKEFVSPAPGGKNGVAWKNQFGYVGITGFGMDNLVAEGMNEAGLAYSVLWYEPNVKYQEVAPGEENRALAVTLAGSWILGSFSTIEEVKKAVADVKMWGDVVPALHMSPPGHVALYERSGKSAVLEFDNGKLNIYDNPLGVLTNAPSFPWHMNHLRQFIGMSNENPEPRKIAGMTFIPTGHGAGMIGLPGDLTPPSRFVRLTVTTQFADKPGDAKDSLKVCQHIVNAFNIVSGMVVDKNAQG